MGDYKKALSIYRGFSEKINLIDGVKFNQKLHSIGEKYKIELKAQNDLREKSKVIWICVGGIIILIMSVIILLLLMHNSKTKRALITQEIQSKELENSKLKIEKDLAIQEVRTKELENAKLEAEKELALQVAKTKELVNSQLKVEKDLAMQKAKTAELDKINLKAEKEKLELKNKNLQLERDNKTLEAENLTHRIEILENESNTLKKLLVTQESIPIEVREAIRVRVEMLNSHLARLITSKEKYGVDYDIWIKDITNNTEEFMNSTRLAFQASHPRFIQYFIDHNLTVDEINYVCLYAIGLHGREVGDFIKKRSHVNMSSAIRKKLGIDKHETNIGIYVRKLLKNF